MVSHGSFFRSAHSAFSFSKQNSSLVQGDNHILAQHRLHEKLGTLSHIYSVVYPFGMLRPRVLLRRKSAQVIW